MSAALNSFLVASLLRGYEKMKQHIFLSELLETQRIFLYLSF